MSFSAIKAIRSLKGPPAAPAAAPAPCPAVALRLPPDGALLRAGAPGCGLLASPGLPDAVAYVPDAITAHDEAALLAAVYASPPGRWVALRNRRLQMYGGVVTAGGLADAEPLPPWLDALAGALVAAGVYPPACRPNHVLVNEYARGQGILPHTDGPAYFPRTTTLSLGTPAVMRLAPRGPPGTPFAPTAEVVLQPRSLVVFGGEAYAGFLHAISEDPEEVVGASAPVANGPAAGVAPGDTLQRGLRMSLTIRHVPHAGGGGGGGAAGVGEAGAAAGAPAGLAEAAAAASPPPPPG